MGYSRTMTGVLEGKNRIFELKMHKQIYLIEITETSDFSRDINLARRIAELHRQEPVDCVFLNPEEDYGVLRIYCDNNRNRRIRIDLTEEKSPTDVFLDMRGYIKKNPNEQRFARVEQPENMDRLSELLSREYSVKRI
ncbi:MAG: hypothetical protein Q8N99_05300 [Nanoarchaeota archaeon]|nr:hypothetical protein [Nanoarchaeota archaeon]